MSMLTLSPSISTTTTIAAAATAAATTTAAPTTTTTTMKPDAPADTADSSSSPNGVIDMETFHQILDLDEDETHDFSAGMAWAYFEQAGTTFQDMEEALYVMALH